MKVKLPERKELFLCVCVSLVLMTLMAILPVHATSGTDEDHKFASGPSCGVGAQVYGYWTTEDSGIGYYKTDHIATRWAISPVVAMPPFIMYYANPWDGNTSKYTMLPLTQLTKTGQGSPNGVFGRTKTYSQFKNQNTGEAWGLQTDWAQVQRWT